LAEAGVSKNPAHVHWIIGTAGHIDHGKTALVKALTGQDTDRLKEEKERGISIDLGFAHLDLPDSVRAGIVDVPGHERFIRNMLAGAHGLDLVLFTVAADDGVMPQTQEHFDIIHLLGVTRVIFVITKADLVAEARLEEVAGEIALLVEDTPLARAAVVSFSSVTGLGLDRLRSEIATILHAGLRTPPEGYFRLPVDRAFASPGHGLIVTGTAISGEVRVGDKVRLLPRDEVVRVRSIEVHNESVEMASWAQRIALNLTRSGDSSLVRGDVVCDERITLVCDRFDARVEIRPSEKSGIKDHQRVRVYLGTAERLGKVIPLVRDGRTVDRIAPGETAYCQIALSEPMVAMRGDHFILRDETAQRTIGGGAVIHPAAVKHKRNDPQLAARLEAFERGDEAAMIGAGPDFAMSSSVLAQLMNRRDQDEHASVAHIAGIHVYQVDGDTQYVLDERRRNVKASLLQALGVWHRARPLLAGVDIEEARAGLPAPVAPKLFRLLIQEFERDGALVREGNLLRLPDHHIEVPDADRAIVDRIKDLLNRSPLAPPDARQLAQDVAIDRRKLTELLRAMENQKTIVAVAPDLYFPADTVDRIRHDMIRDLSAGGTITAAEFRDRHQTTRKYAIPLLEYFDREGVTVRDGEVRRLRRPRVTETA
jgi:selenocysteine-specific elongation factor